MPAFITHDLFGQKLLQNMQEDLLPFAHHHSAKGSATSRSGRLGRPGTPCSQPIRSAASNAQAAFLLGNQGPDPFFFELFTSQMVTLKHFGGMLHDKLVSQAINAMRTHCAQAPAHQRAVLQAYIAGYLCHYSLDSVAHPFIYSQQYSLCAAGIPGLDKRDGTVVHGLIEAELDAMMLYRICGQTIRSFKPAREILRINSESLAALDALYHSVAKQVFSLIIAPDAFSRCVWDMRLTLHAFYSPRSIKSVLLGQLERLARRHSLVQAMSTPVRASKTSDFDNHQGQRWLNPFTQEASTMSFVQLFETAQQQASKRLQLLATGAPTSEFALDLNFQGAAL